MTTTTTGSENVNVDLAGFNPGEARDVTGKWSTSGGGGKKSGSKKTGGGRGKPRMGGDGPGGKLSPGRRAKLIKERGQLQTEVKRLRAKITAAGGKRHADEHLSDKGPKGTKVKAGGKKQVSKSSTLKGSKGSKSSGVSRSAAGSSGAKSGVSRGTGLVAQVQELRETVARLRVVLAAAQQRAYRRRRK